ncbi:MULTISPECIES: acyltransferase family protein [Rhizobium]|uniref:acyltransferase family protein n=1 Tax=Rhizobium TaxID=379 RepID=UPI001C900C8C|nr:MULTISPECIES: acyltransferase [Rhizobium]MBY3053603.1 acyltransferase [Rhizobium laguerreae]MBY3130629.1 acyltransferase [Rhizobium laguerreae]MBY3172390.1 acyltransferase [Rhizobium laguerreae]MBY5608314.1 acyltransferase [Rhizobium leguminosarum]MBY5656554.1 acyltransferase [Rhizobium leguminosarum]
MRSLPSSNRIEGLDTVRAVAALSVVFAHLLGPSMPGISRYIFTGHPAVIAFFVVSGFCIHYPHRLRGLQVAPFLAGRFIRIVPPATAAFILAQVMGMRAYNPIDGYILWSVVCEAVYYCLYPLILPISRRIGWPVLIAVSVIASYGVAIGLGSDQYGNAMKYGPQLNWVVGLPAWLLGCYLAQNLDRLKLPGSVWGWRVATAASASALYWATTNTGAGFYLTMVPFSVLAGCWILAEIRTATDRGPIRFLEKIGAACFSIYLVHAIAAAAVDLIVTAPMIVCALSLALVYPFYRWIEKPCHAAARRAKIKMEQLEVRRRLEEGVDFGG